MKYALKFTPAEELETTMWVWFQDHGVYYVDDRSGIVKEASPGFVDSNLQPEFSDDVERVSFADVPEHVHGHDPRDILEKLPREYNE
ncbi:hypothetical protein [Natrinema pallidum]|uniref:Uncharacterized protein n=1 Tax=Natrinema pallidum TaxID=69527 RepID=A0A4P9TJU4_9EURY|nr:hypothetical protein [Natrinema pallidum]QCW05281.1 hypothetical protein FGF80_18740 [Natrinema pallidum]